MQKPHRQSGPERVETDAGVRAALVAWVPIGQGESAMQVLAELFR